MFHLNSTSNHNFVDLIVILAIVVFHLNSTSNHNMIRYIQRSCPVVFHLNSTSNHNYIKVATTIKMLCFILILHQTTTTVSVIIDYRNVTHLFFYKKKTKNLRRSGFKCKFLYPIVQIYQKSSNCCGISGLECSILPQ